MEDSQPVSLCSYEFDIDDWSEAVQGGSKRLPSEWSCPHESTDSTDYCPFHANGVDPDVVRTAFHEALTHQETERNSFVGATLPDLGLSGDHIETQSPIDLRAVTFTEKLDLDDVRFSASVRFEGSHFEQRLEMDDTHFGGEVSFYGCRFDGVLEGKGTVFTSSAYFIGCEFKHSLLLTSNATFEADVFFTGTLFESTADFSNAAFEGQTFFRDVGFEGRAVFDRASFRETVRFAGAVFTESLSFNYAWFHGIVQFGGLGINRRYDAARFECRLEFEHVTCSQSVYFAECTFERGAGLVESTFESAVDVSDVNLSEDLFLSGSEFETLTLAPERTSGTLLAECIDTTLNDGTIEQPTVGELFCHFEEATLGSVTFSNDSDTESDGVSRLNRVRFVDTEFDGFDFTNYRVDLERSGELYRFTATNSFGEPTLSPSERERTYMRAKSGANMIGDNRAASSFFVEEMRARGARQRERFRNQFSFRDGLRYIGNRVFWLSSNYAESPIRVVANSFLAIFLFAIGYAVLFARAGATPPYPDSTFDGYLILSGESFVTLVHQPAATIPNSLVRVLTVFEGFLGAFAIALFLFALTRAVHR